MRLPLQLSTCGPGTGLEATGAGSAVGVGDAWEEAPTAVGVGVGLDTAETAVAAGVATGVDTERRGAGGAESVRSSEWAWPWDTGWL